MNDISFFDNVYRYRILDSTVSEAKKIIGAKREEGNFLIIADTQTDGIGRKGNDWYSPHGGLWITAGLYNLPVKNCITLFTALMVIRTIIKLCPDAEEYIGIKWPNDIFLDGKKVGGILTSFFPSLKYLLISIGINTNNTDLPKSLEATSLISFLRENNPFGKPPHPLDNDKFLDELFTQFGNDLPAIIESNFDNYISEYQRYSIIENKMITFITEFQDYKGIVKGISKEGALLLQIDNDLIQPFLSGSVTEGYR